MNHLEELRKKIPLFGNNEIHINNSNVNSYDYHAQEDKSILNISIENPAITYPLPPTQTPHELSHVLLAGDISYLTSSGSREIVPNHLKLVRYFPPKEAVQIMILQEKILADPILGRQYPKNIIAFPIFQKETWTSADLGNLATVYATQRWNEWSNDPEKERIEKTDAEHLAQLLGLYFEFNDKLIQDENLSLIEDFIQTLKS